MKRSYWIRTPALCTIFRKKWFLDFRAEIEFSEDFYRSAFRGLRYNVFQEISDGNFAPEIAQN